MKIILDANNYHLNKESKNEIAFINTLIEQLFSMHDELKVYIDNQFNEKQLLYSKEERDRCIYKLVKGIVNETYSDLGDEVKSKKFYKELYGTIIYVLPYLLENESSISMERFYLYEPHIILVLNICNTMQEIVDSEYDFDKDSYNKKSLMLMCHNAVRAIKASLMMFAIGDDVHGKALYRGIIELIARICVLPTQPDDFEEFNDVNAWVQEIYKHNEDEQMAIDIKEAFKAKYKINESQLESFMLYGWAKNKNNKRIRTAAEMISLAFGDTAQTYKELYHEASEFIHEDYVLTPYDYIGMRRESKTYLVIFLYLVFMVEKQLIHLPEYIEEYFNKAISE